MRPLTVAAVAIAAALVGGLTAFGLAVATDMTGQTTTVVAPVEPPPAEAPSAPTALSGQEGALPGNGFDAAAIYAARSPGVVTIYADLGASGSSQGSGFVVDRRGRVLTNAHVITNVSDRVGDVRGAERVFVEFADGERAPARVIGWDLFNDTGVIEIGETDHPLAPVPLGDSDAVRVGHPVAAIGSPFGKQNSLAVGVVSATGRTIDSLTSGFAISDAIQIDAPINRGNSGGPLFDARGRVVGINAQIQSTSGTAEGVGFAIPINSARRSLRQLVATGRVQYAYIGITTQDVTPGVAAALGLPASRGALVAAVEPGTPAARAGLRGGSERRTVYGLDVTSGGDLIVAIDGQPVRSSDDVGRIVARRLLPGDTVPVVIVRDGTRRIVDVTLADRPASRG
ncbi:MAG: S1C family serine protease [Gaiella sp.]